MCRGSTCAFNNFQINVNLKLPRSRLTFRSSRTDIHSRIFSCTETIECKRTHFALYAESKISSRRSNQIHYNERSSKAQREIKIKNRMKLYVIRVQLCR